MSYSTTKQFKPGSWEEAMYDYYSGLSVGALHSMRLVTNWIKSTIVRPTSNLLHHQTSSESTEEKPTLKVVGVGFGRTGTYSLTLALEELGFPTLHTQHLYENHAIFNMWTNNVFLPSLNSNSATMGSPDFDLIASHGYSGTADLPMALYYEQIADYYPDCKFILTTRESSEIWFRSWDVLTKSIVQPARYGSFATAVKKLGYYLRWLFSVVNKDNSYLKAPFPLPDQNKERAIESYEEHNRRVREVIPPHRLLEYNVKQGWEPLCDFLEVSNCPTSPFPKSNSARAVQVQAISSLIFPLTVTLLIIFSLFSYSFQKLTGKPVLQWLSSDRPVKSLFNKKHKDYYLKKGAKRKTKGF